MAKYKISLIFCKTILLTLFIFISIVLSTKAYTNNIKNSAVVYMYHRFGEDKYPSTNVSEEQFLSHIDYILNNEIKVITLEELIKDIDQNKKFNDKAVAFSVDDAYSSFYQIAWPIFRDHGIPVTLFSYTTILKFSSCIFVST